MSGNHGAYSEEESSCVSSDDTYVPKVNYRGGAFLRLSSDEEETNGMSSDDGLTLELHSERDRYHRCFSSVELTRGEGSGYNYESSTVNRQMRFLINSQDGNHASSDSSSTSDDQSENVIYEEEEDWDLEISENRPVFNSQREACNSKYHSHSKNVADLQKLLREVCLSNSVEALYQRCLRRSLRTLFTPSMDGILAYIGSGRAKKIITVAGAGISTAAGIPDFRTPRSGIFYNLLSKRFLLPNAIFNKDYFERDPVPFFSLMAELTSGKFKPTKTHYFIKMLMEKNCLLRHYTMNIDGLERKAGLDSDILVEAHGTFHYSQCSSCYEIYEFDWLKSKLSTRPIKVPKCSCGGMVKPDIVFLGESLKLKFYRLLDSDFPSCDLLIIMGSSLLAEPFSYLCNRVNDRCPRLLVNSEAVGENVGLQYNEDDNYRDVAWIGDCDSFCNYLIDKLGWKSELENLYK